jgi:hypothetical protein
MHLIKPKGTLFREAAPLDTADPKRAWFLRIVQDGGPMRQPGPVLVDSVDSSVLTSAQRESGRLLLTRVLDHLVTNHASAQLNDDYVDAVTIILLLQRLLCMEDVQKQAFRVISAGEVQANYERSADYVLPIAAHPKQHKIS